MAFIMVDYFEFTYLGEQLIVNINFDITTGTIETFGSDVPNLPSGISRNFQNGDEMISPYCEGADLKKLIATNIYPYAVLQTEANSGSCSVTPAPDPTTCDIVIDNVGIANETAFNKKDGRAIIDASTSAPGTKYYSVDGVNFSSVNLFTDLAPGNYTAHARDSNGCTTTKPFTITAFAPIYGCMDQSAINYDPSAQVDDGSCQYPSPSPDPTDVDMFNLYEKEDQFRLVTDSGFSIIREPVGWDKVNLVLKRDNDTHGVDFDFSDGSIQLSFTEVSGRSIIQDELSKKGTDANIKLQFGFIKGAVFIIEYEGDLYFNTPFKRTYNSIDCTVKRKTLNDNIETRYETPITLTANKTIDGSDMPVMNGVVLPLHSKSIIERFLQEKTYDASQHQLFSYPRDSNFDHNYYITPDLSTATTNEIDTPGTNGFGVYKENPIDVDKWDWNLKSNGNFSFEIKLSTRFHFYLTPSTFGSSGRILAWDYQWKLVRNRSGNLTTHDIGSRLTGYTTDRELDFYWGGSLNVEMDLRAGDKIYIFGRFGFDGDRNWRIENPEIWMNSTLIKIQGKTETEPTNANSYLIHESVDRIIKSVTDNKGYLISDFLGRPDLGYAVMGPGAKKAITNGYQIRNFSKEDRPVIVSLKDLVESLNAMHCMGSSYEVDNLGRSYFRLERFDYFYRDVEIMTIENPSDYFEEADLDSIFNEIEIGYAKYPEDDVTTLDEYNTKHSYITPIVSYKKKLSQLSKLITSGYAIELTRRKKFADTELDSWKYDEDNFAIALLQNGSAWVPEKNEAFSVVEEVISPETSYNLRLSPKRMLQAWAKLLNTGFVFKRGIDLIKNTFYSKNGDLKTQYNPAEQFNIGDPDKLLTVEKADVMLSEFDRFDRIFAPEKINFKASLNINQINFIKRCHQNRDNGGRNYGYIRVKDNEGNYQVGYLTKMEYNPVSEMTTLILRKKYANLGNQFDCSDYSDWNFSQFEAATGLSPEIEQCKFNDFN